MKKAMFLLRTIVIGVFLSCGNRHPDWNGGIIKEFGVYHVSNKNYTIEVYSRDGILNFFVKNLSGKRMIAGPSYGASTYQNWTMYFDKNNDLWLESSDIGIYLWKYVGPDEYKEIDVEKETQYLQQMPKEFKK